MPPALSEDIRENISDLTDGDGVLLEGLEEAIMGVCESFSGSIVLYDKAMCIDILASRMDCDSDEESYLAAVEYFEYNVAGLGLGKDSPGFFVSCGIDRKAAGVSVGKRNKSQFRSPFD